MVKQSISAEQIITAAFEILQASGTVDALSIRKIANQLDIGAATFYWHFENKQTLLQAMADNIIQQIEIEPCNTTLEWTDQIRQIFSAIYTTYIAQPYAAELMMRTVPATKARLGLINHLIQILLDAGFTPEQASLAIESIDHFMSGLFTDITGELEMKHRVSQHKDTYLAQLPLKMQQIATDNHYNAFLRTFEHHRHQQQRSLEKFMLGIDIFLAGLQQQLA
ncbi:TetR/AcrR family transcriptional regulator C-terminal domain-containing protein [Latilactobacillus curvatus]|uniref:TetR family transcriptional regulator n=1 Tax=Latilactobacillus curvatus TaxID=28038 RepID=A0ABM7QTI3_LATCU|nr:TetR/AcrR family transcriptional regulator C-terminal domain-containing protein [Latilactobacillus curvatus]ANJ68771.1 hypothetical protein FBA2_01540 [Latilactobacillus curvatus]QEA49136.1 TetR family transcriptional regulator [Latilactobacillus curvatus]WBY48720.1 TetR/AcrR family transcriptional regulator C-terminal domain-containing protein [Latilactobacillus curvatus]WIE00651.1 TetR/AcrR family transcriptional regulator C-terminal domain-containing protein [Latilactobacillus curvatus]B